jgi:hypothetical protein
MIELACVPPEDAAQLLPVAEPLLRSALAHTGIGDFQDIRDGILAGTAFLWLAIEDGDRILAAASTQLQTAAVGRVCVVTACGGHSIRDWVHLIAKVET